MKLPILDNTALNEKVILVTGAGDGIGKQAALHYAKLGATVILLGKTKFKLEQVFDQIIEQNYPEPIILVKDLSQADGQYFEDLADSIEQTLGRLDGVLLNASELGTIQPTANISIEEFDKVMQVNVRSQFFLTQSLIPLLSSSPTASIIFTSSSVSQVPRAYWGTYCISKSATDNMMRLFADEYENSPLRFNSVNPGATRTNMRAKAYPAEQLDNLMAPEEIMGIYQYLMSDVSSNHNGKLFRVQPSSNAAEMHNYIVDIES